MKISNHIQGTFRSWFITAFTLGGGMFVQAAETPGITRSKLDDKMIVESGAAARVSEKVRAGAAGVIVEISVSVGDKVKKGQVLGHTELPATKYQLDLARQALEDNTSLNAAQGHAQAWAATRAETEEAVRKRKVEKPRLDWATGMEQFHSGQYDAQVERKKVQRIQYEYWQEQYEARFFRAPVDGVVTEILHDLGKSVPVATHVFTISDSNSYLVPVTVPEEYAASAATNSTFPIRVSNGRHVSRGIINSIADDPKAPGKKIITLLVNEKDFPKPASGDLSGSKFDVLLPQVDPTVAETGDPRDPSPPSGDTAPIAPAAKP